jgi:hypothetical protein
MEDLYEVKIEVTVPKILKIKAKDENEALEKVQQLLEEKNIERTRIQEMTWNKIEEKSE